MPSFANKTWPINHSLLITATHSVLVPANENNVCTSDARRLFVCSRKTGPSFFHPFLPSAASDSCFFRQLLLLLLLLLTGGKNKGSVNEIDLQLRLPIRFIAFLTYISFLVNRLIKLSLFLGGRLLAKYSKAGCFFPNNAFCATEIGFSRWQIWTLGPLQGVPCFGIPEQPVRAKCNCLDQLFSATLCKLGWVAYFYGLGISKCV